MTAQSNSTLASAPYRNMVINSLNFEIFDDGTVSRVAQLKACFELGLVKEGNTLEELGKAAGIDPKALA